jgi:putative drug exporter of the RND superfamily
LDKLPKSFFDALNGFIRKRYRWVIIAWVIVVVLSLFLIPRFFSAVSYDLTSGFGAPSNTESEKTANIIQTQFPNSVNGSGNTILIVIDGVPVYSDALKQNVLEFNDLIAKDQNIANYTGTSSLYSLENSLLNSSLPSIITQAGNLQQNIITINSGAYSLQQNLSALSMNLFQLQDGLNQITQLVYGVPAAFAGVWEGITAQGLSDPYMANVQANATAFAVTGNFGGAAQSIAYYSAFFNIWNSSFQTLPNNTTVLDREAFAINQTVSAFLSNPQLDAQTSQMIMLAASGLNVKTWNQPIVIANMAISTVSSSIPAELSSSLGTSPTSLVNQLFSFGPSPSNETLGNYTLSLFVANYSNMTSASSGAGFPVSELVQSAYLLGLSPNDAQTWGLACNLIATATQSTFADSPLFSVNAASLRSLLSGLSLNATVADMNHAIETVISTQSYKDYPYVPSNSLTHNFIDSKNDSMLIVLSFSSNPDTNTIAQVESDVQNSGLRNLGTVYVTGGSVLTKDVEKAFLPALEITVGPGIAISLLIVGLLFLAPVAALIPVLLGGVSVSVALASIYISIVDIGHGSITFLTPTLTVLLMLGLAVDYAVLQLKRTKEERQQGKSLEESVGISIKWAGQAVLTAGITVIVAYIVMAIANVPLFNDVGTAIALGVSILLAAALTLLPALEFALGDKIFWPSLNRHNKPKSGPNKNILRRVAQGTLKRKVPIVIVISAVSLGAFFVTYETPTGFDFLKLIPNFPSNQGLTVIADNFGSGTIAPTSIVITTPTPITYGNNQFNQTLLNQIEQITAAAAGSKGVATVTGATRPFGNTFNYSSIEDMSEPLRMQYESQIFSTIGKDNKTTVITVGLSGPAPSQSTIDSLRGMETNIQKVSLVSGVAVNFGGQTQSTYDNQTFMANLLPEVVIILSIAVYVILFFQLRSAFTPVRLIITILCSVVFSLAIISLVFYVGLNFPIMNFAPLFVVVTMLGVGIDYDIFFVTRIREEVLNGKTDDEAIITAIEKVWVTVLCLGLVLSIVFGSLFITGIAILQEFSLAVAAAVMLDVTVVLLFFVPSLMGLAQKFNWWPYKLSNRKQQENKT